VTSAGVAMIGLVFDERSLISEKRETRWKCSI
jgi:hypothetical protein